MVQNAESAAPVKSAQSQVMVWHGRIVLLAFELVALTHGSREMAYAPAANNGEPCGDHGEWARSYLPGIQPIDVTSVWSDA